MQRASGDPRVPGRRATVFAGLVCLAATGVAAQGVEPPPVVLDPSFSSATVGPGEYAPGMDTHYLIRESYGQRSGNNLFHRFSRFDVPANESATFVASSTGIERVIAHVASEHASKIDGTIRSTIPGADLYFLNPRGVIFGEGARLDLPGAFHVSSASYLRFADGTRFGQDAGGSAVTITSADPAAWGFLSAPLSELDVGGAQLHTTDQADLSLVGGGITITGPGNRAEPTLQAPSATMTLVSVGSGGEVVFGADATTPPDVSGFSTLGPITLGGDAVLDASGVDDQRLIVRGDSLSVDGATILANHTGPADHTGDAVDIEIENEILFRRPASTFFPTLESLVYRPNGAAGADVGSGGRVSITASEFLAEGSAVVIVGAVCTQNCLLGDEPGGDGGDLEFDVDRLSVREDGLVYVTNNGRGDGGDLTVRAREIVLNERGGIWPGLVSENGQNPNQPSVTTFTQGRGGHIVLEASERVLLEDGARLQTYTYANGRGGDIIIRTGDFEMVGEPIEDFPTLVSTETFSENLVAPASGEGRAGDIMIEATGDITIDTLGTGLGTELRSIGYLDPAKNINGLTGMIHLRAPEGRLRLDGGARIYSALNAGHGAPILLEANSLEVLGGSAVTTTHRGLGTVGDILIDAVRTRISGTRPIPMGDPQSSAVTTNPIQDSAASADSGSITIEGRLLEISDRAQLLIEGNRSGSSGDIRIGHRQPLQSVVIDNATIEAGTTGSGGTMMTDGGTIEIRADSIRMDNEAMIIASNFRSGGAGSIRLIGEELEMSGGSMLATNAGQVDVSGDPAGFGGNISIQMTRRFQANDAAISANAPSSNTSSSGGNLDIEAPVLVLSQTALTATSNENAGGTIQIVSGQLLIAANNPPPDASGGSTALDGVVEILSAETNTTSAVPRPTIAYEDPTRRLATGCEARKAAQGSLYLLPRPIDVPPGEGLDVPDTPLAPSTSACGPPS